MSPETLSLAVLFADISQSTRIYEALGNRAGQKLVADCLKLLSDVTAQHQGTVVKTIGDEVMCVFAGADLAVKAARAMQEALDQTPVVVRPGINNPNIRVGIHLGSVIKTGDDVFGDGVHVAKRMVDMAKARQILTTEETVEALSPEVPALIRRIDKTMVKGKWEELNIYEVIWEQDVTVVMQKPLTSLALKSNLKLRFADELIELDRSRPFATMGRHRDNDLVVDDVLASRIHARIEYRRGRFVLIDQSTNGTYVLPEGEETICLQREELPLQGSGIICLGRPLVEDSPLAIHFTSEP